ncbi:MAG: hypothetical protein FVQ81_17090 [Candidatus Glassbacteria bacterium]|nr:hypothetical protein [Candidatus Glassbacteria bacterium]
MRTLLLVAISVLLAVLAGCIEIEINDDNDAEDRQSAAAEQECPRHCMLLRAGEIEAIIGDGARIRNHPGLWLLASEHYPFNVIHNKSAAMLGGGLRNREPVLKKIDEFSCALERTSTPDDPSDIRAVYRISEPYYLDYEHNVRDTEDRIGPLLNHRSWGYANYTNSPDDLRIHFLSDGEWFAWTPGEHGGAGSQVVPNYLPKEKLETWPEDHPDPSFWWHKRLDRGFDEPFFYGRFENMVAIWVFDKPEWLRFHLSPQGGGKSLREGKTSTAWDFEWIIPRREYEVGKWYQLRCRIIFKEFEGNNDVLREVRKAQQELGFTTVADLQ